MELFPGERKRWSPTSYLLYAVFDHGWYEFQLKYRCLCFFLCKTQCQILLKGISDATNIVTYHTVTNEKTVKKVPWFSFSFSLFIKIILDLLKWLKETTFYEKKKEIIIKTWTLHKREDHIKKKESSWIFWIQEKLILKMIFLQYLRNLHDII